MPIQGEPDKPPWPHRRPGPDGDAGGSLGGKPAPVTSSSAMLAADCEPLRGDLAPESAEGPLRGVLASRGSVPWNWAWWFRTAYWSPPVVGLPVPVGLAEDPLAEPAPPAAAEAAVEARRFVCECCKRMSFVLPADVSTYIICPFCGKLSTTDASKSKRMANTYFFLGTAFPIVVTMLFVILDEFLDRSAQRYVPVYFRLLLFLFVSAVCLKRAWDFQSLPRGSLLGGYLYVLPDLHHVAGNWQRRAARTPLPVLLAPAADTDSRTPLPSPGHRRRGPPGGSVLLTAAPAGPVCCLRADARQPASDTPADSHDEHGVREAAGSTVRGARRHARPGGGRRRPRRPRGPRGPRGPAAAVRGGLLHARLHGGRRHDDSTVPRRPEPPRAVPGGAAAGDAGLEGVGAVAVADLLVLRLPRQLLHLRHHHRAPDPGHGAARAARRHHRGAPLPVQPLQHILLREARGRRGLHQVPVLLGGLHHQPQQHPELGLLLPLPGAADPVHLNCSDGVGGVGGELPRRAAALHHRRPHVPGDGDAATQLRLLQHPPQHDVRRLRALPAQHGRVHRPVADEGLRRRLGRGLHLFILPRVYSDYFEM